LTIEHSSQSNKLAALSLYKKVNKTCKEREKGEMYEDAKVE
jgi:hypothetical protein